MNSELFWSGIATAAVIVIGALVAAYQKITGQWHKEKVENETRLLNDYGILVDRQAKEIEAKNKELAAKSKEVHDGRDRENELNLRLTICESERARLEERVANRPWKPSDSSSSMDTES